MLAAILGFVGYFMGNYGFFIYNYKHLVFMRVLIHAYSLIGCCLSIGVLCVSLFLYKESVACSIKGQSARVVVVYG